MGESYIAGTSGVEDLLELGRFSLGGGVGTQTVKMVSVKRVEDLERVLEIASRQEVERGKSVMVTLWVMLMLMLMMMIIICIIFIIIIRDLFLVFAVNE